MTASTTPETWFHITLGDVVRVSSGMGFPQKYQGKQEGIYPVYKVGDISNAVINHKGKAFLAGNYVGELEANELKGEIFCEGATLFAKIGEAIKLNRRAFVTRAGLADNNVMAVIPEKLISKRFIYYFMRTVDLTDASRSTTVPSIRKGDIECLPLNIPSQAEQKEIADRLDILLAQVEATQARLVHIPEIIKNFRQSVLSDAVSGKLTEEWRNKNNTTPPKEVWSSAKETRSPYLIPEGWLSVTLGSISEKVSVGHVGKTTEFYTEQPDGIPFLRSQNVRPGGISKNGLALIKKEAHESLKKSQLKPGDLLVVRVGANRGDACILPDIFDAVNCANIVFSRPLKGLSEYLNIFFQSPIAQSLLLGETVGGAQGVINTKSVASAFVALPSHEEQIEIVRRVEQLFAYADTIEQQAKAAKARVDKLTQAILAKAFRGELTADWRAANPDLISGDNSAAALLAGIQAERAAAKPRKNRRV
ncbi:restriction endonuclease subunit S [Aeromonas media]|uniref:restriction endonuclease subunit S n=1 Tax=Aeromonas media TaxID=651 RepID=UPI00111A6371|nr:restriction endonuclease subunit S [Aeromonas media]TNI72485.1 type I restriction endonuclease subunit S [Aeromonas media]